MSRGLVNKGIFEDILRSPIYGYKGLFERLLACLTVLSPEIRQKL